MGTRPILDRAKVALFDWLGSRLAQPGMLPPVAVLDLFCGGGSLGIESISRGAAHVAFVDADAGAIAALRSNLAMLKVGGDQAVVHHTPVEIAGLRCPLEQGYSLIFLDPPYRLTADLEPGSTIRRVLARLDGDIPAAPGALMIWRHEVAQDTPDSATPNWRCIERRAWGHVAITAYQFGQADEADGGAAP